MKCLVTTAILTLCLSGSIIASAKLAIDMSSKSKGSVATAQEFAPRIGNLTFSAALASENEVLLNVTFQGAIYVTQPGFVWTLWISNSSLGYNRTNLPEGLKLVEGLLKVNDTCPLPCNCLSLQAKLQAIADGEWTVYGHFSATHGPGLYYGINAAGIQITVSNGHITQIEKKQTTILTPQEGGEMQKVPLPL